MRQPFSVGRIDVAGLTLDQATGTFDAAVATDST